MSGMRRISRGVGAVWLVCAAWAACGSDGGASQDAATETSDTGDDGDTTDTVAVDSGGTLITPDSDASETIVPLETEVGVWTWFDQPGSACSDGSATGFAVNRGTSDDLLVLFMGGGACWDFEGCFLLGAAATGPFGRGQFEALGAALNVGVLDRTDPDNPYRSFTQVFVPYCTGDLHAGERDMDYVQGGLTRTWHHRGGTNARLLLARLAATFHAPERLAMAGLSAGGYGATLQYAAFRDALAPAAAFLVDDSGPLLIGDAIPAVFRSKWFTNWRLDAVVDPVCGQGCKTDLSLLYGKLAERYPDDRMALVSSVADATIRSYFQLDAAAFETAIRALAGQLAGLSPFRSYLVAGDSHTTLASPGDFDQGGVDLRAWLGAMLAGDAAWVDVAPP